jgi:hypothetical protein
MHHFLAKITGFSGLKCPKTALSPENPVILAGNDNHAKITLG